MISQVILGLPGVITALMHQPRTQAQNSHLILLLPYEPCWVVGCHAIVAKL